MILRRDPKAMKEAKALLAALVLEDGRLIGDVWEPWQWRLAEWVFDDRARPNRWESRPRGGSKSTDIAGICMVAMVELDPAGSRSYAIAVDRDQGRLISEAAAGFVARTPALASRADGRLVQGQRHLRQHARGPGRRRSVHVGPQAAPRRL